MEPKWEVVLHAEVEHWLGALTEEVRDRIVMAIDLLEEHGPALSRPLVDTVTGSRFSNMKELRVSTYRLLFAFDPRRQAIVLVGGDKRGNWSRWYPRAIRLADERLTEWLGRQEGE